MLPFMAINWTTFNPVQGDGYIDVLTGEFATTDLISILAGILGITVAFTLVWRFAAYIRRTVIGAMTNSKRKRGW